MGGRERERWKEPPVYSVSMVVSNESMVKYRTFVACSRRPSQHGAELEQVIVVDGMELDDSGRRVAVVGVEFFDEPFGCHVCYRYMFSCTRFPLLHKEHRLSLEHLLAHALSMLAGQSSRT